LYLTIRSLDPTGRGQARWITRWKAALNAFAITFDNLIRRVDDLADLGAVGKEGHELGPDVLPQLDATWASSSPWKSS
jgi:hypothetical protein